MCGEHVRMAAESALLPSNFDSDRRIFAPLLQLAMAGERCTGARNSRSVPRVCRGIYVSGRRSRRARAPARRKSPLRPLAAAHTAHGCVTGRRNVVEPVGGFSVVSSSAIGFLLHRRSLPRGPLSNARYRPRPVRCGILTIVLRRCIVGAY